VHLAPRILAVAAAATLLAAAPASAQIAPTLSSPSNGKSIKRGVPFTFKAKLDSASEGSGVFLKVSTSKKVGSDGTLAKDIYFRAMKQSGGSWAKKVERYAALSDHFLNRPGRYYWQAYSIDCSGGTDDCNIESSIRTFRIR
jgi:hypothetical protein